MKRCIYYGGATVLFALSMFAQSAQRSGEAHRDMAAGHNPDQAFMKEAAQGGMAEVELGNLAQQKAASEQVKQFGRRMVDDHGKANNELKALAGQKNVTLPTDMGPKHQAHYDRMARLNGAEFDRAYVSHMVMDHRKDVQAFERESNSGKDPDVKAWAGKTLPVLKEHLTQIQGIQSSMGAGTSDAHHSGKKSK